MAAVSGILGVVTSWSGTFNASLLTGSRPAQFSLNMAGDDLDTTAFADLGVETHIKGLSSWSGSFTAQLAAPAIGALGLVTFAGGYVTNLNAWTLNAAANALETTAFGATVKTFIPGTLNWGGTFSGYQDGTTALTAPANSGEPATGTFKYQEAGAVDNQVAGSIFTTALGLTVQPNAVNAVSYSYRGSGALTHADTTAGTTAVWTKNTALATPILGDIVLTSYTGRTFTAAAPHGAFWTGISISVGVNQATTVQVSFQGTGTLTIA